MARRPAGRPGVWWLGVALLVVLAAAVRSLGFEWVFVDDLVVFPIADAQYHVRRALYGFHQFPAALLFDPYINHPDGAAVAWPPGWDWALAAVGQLLPGEAAFERWLAWAPVLVGALTVVPVSLAARRLGGAPAGWASGLFLALLPVHATFARVGNVDHHVAVALLGAGLLLVAMRMVEEPERLGREALLLFLLRTALMLSWHGSLLYVAVVDGALVLAVVATGCRRTAAAHAGSAAAGAGVLGLYVAATPPPLLGPFSSIALSWLHVLALLGVCAVQAALFALAARRPAASPWLRVGAAVAAGAVFLALVLALPGARAGLEPALRFLTLSDAAGARTGEQFPLFGGFEREVRRPAWISWGLAAYTIPLVPPALLLALRRRPAVWLLAGWTAAFGVLAIGQRRYGNDLAPAMAVALGVLAVRAAELLPRSGRLRVPAAAARLVPAAVVLLLLAPGLAAVHAPRLRSLLTAGAATDEARLDATVAGTLTRFARAVRRHTPETQGFLDPSQVPEYGIVSHANLGHALQNVARRPTPTDPFWSYIGEQNWERAFGLLEAEDEATALRLAEELAARYVVTMPAPGRGLEARLHFRDGGATDELPHLGHFRLVVEAPPTGRAAGEIFARTERQASGIPPYKLFEIVPGARVSVSGAPGEEVTISTRVIAPGGRRFAWRARATIGAEGRAELTLPYGTGSRRTAGPRQPYRVEIGDRRFALPVSAAQVEQGAEIRCCPP